jgi:phytoene dehydrogenase-like protein
MSEPNRSDERYDVAVIGAGLAGLTAAARLARRGRKVVVFDKAKQIGGRAVTRVADGYCWNLGAHALYRRAEGARVLAELGVCPSGGVPLGSGQYAIDGGRTHALPAGFVSLLSTSLMGLAAKLELARMLVGIARVDPEPLRTTTLERWLALHVRHEDARRFLRAFVRLTTYTDAPATMSAADAVAQLQAALAGNVLYVHGGWQTLVDALASAACAAGVAIETGTAVRAIEGAGCVQGVRTGDGRRVAAGAVIAAVPPQALLGLAPSALGAPLERAIHALVPVRAACLDLALSRLPMPRATFALGIDRPLYLSVHSAVARLAPEGGAVVHLMRYLEPGASGDGAADEAELEGAMDLVQPGWRGHVRERRFLPAMTVAHAAPVAATGGKAGRPAVDAPAMEGLYLAGDWVGAHGLLADASFASAAAAADACHARASNTLVAARAA